MTQHIGIAGCSAEGAALCYRTICAEGPALLSKPYAHPEISMHTPSFADYLACFERDDWNGVADLMVASGEILARAGADFLICPDNAIHRVFDAVAARSPLPWLHIARVVADEAAARGFTRLALTGTRWLVESEVYPDALAATGIAWQRPEPADRAAINRIIMEELVPGLTTPEQVPVFQRIIAAMKGDGCDAVVLGCTEIPISLNDETSPLPTLDSTRLLARAALRRAVGGR